MRRDARAALTIAKNRPKIGLSAGRSSTASFGGLGGGGCSRAELVSKSITVNFIGNLSPKQASDAFIAPVFSKIGS